MIPKKYANVPQVSCKSKSWTSPRNDGHLEANMTTAAFWQICDQFEAAWSSWAWGFKTIPGGWSQKKKLSWSPMYPAGAFDRSAKASGDQLAGPRRWALVALV